MGLIQCADCGKMVSDRADACPNCGCPVSESLKEQPKHICVYNGKPIVFDDETYDRIMKWIEYGRKEKDWTKVAAELYRIMKRCVSDDYDVYSPLVDEIINAESVPQVFNAEIRIRPNPNQKTCPKCGGHDFTPVRRNHSFFGGFATQKVDMICNHCGYRL